MPRNLGETLDLIEFISTNYGGKSDKVTVTTFEKVSPGSVGLGRLDFNAKSLPYVFHEVLRSEWQSRHPPPVSEDGSFDDSDVSGDEGVARQPIFSVKFKTDAE